MQRSQVGKLLLVAVAILLAGPAARAWDTVGPIGEAGRAGRDPRPFPTVIPTIAPTAFPTVAPTSFPTVGPTISPTAGASASPASGQGEGTGDGEGTVEADDASAAVAASVVEDFRREDVLDDVPLVKKHRDIGTSE